MKKADVSQGRFRWLTVTSPEEPKGTERQLALNDTPAARTYQQAMFQQGQPAAMLYTDDLQADCERMKARGAGFTMPPTKRTLPVPEFLQPYLKAIAKGKKPEELLFGHHWRDWPREWVQRICRTAKVPEVTAHGMRGLHGTLAVERGATTHIVAQALGHESDHLAGELHLARSDHRRRPAARPDRPGGGALSHLTNPSNPCCSHLESR